ncbi:MAG: hypothetical protein LIP01_02910 [Tannerellaceae bacterium]|nr:hypothetical protein [Tannerellaceae bacterium]
MNNENTSQAQLNHILNHLFDEKYHYDGNSSIDTSLLLVQYNSSELTFNKLTPEELNYSSLCKPGYTNWFDVIGLNNTELIQRILHELDFYPVDAKSVLTPCHAAKIDDYNKRLVIVIRPSFFNNKNNISSEHICILMKGNTVLTFREQGNISFDHIIKALRLNIMQIRDNDRGMLLAFVLNSILSVMIGTAIKVEEMLGNIDRMLLEENPTDGHIGIKIQRCSYRIYIFKKQQYL